MKLSFQWEKIPSMNSMYIRTYKGICLSKAAREFKESIRLQMQEQLPSSFNSNDLLKLSSSFTLNTRFFVRDVDNMLKLTIDAIFNELGLNDARILEIESRKYYSKNSKESIEIEITKSQLDYDKTTVKK